MIEQDNEQKAEIPLSAKSLILKMIVLIVDEKKTEQVKGFLKENLVRMQYAFNAKGTANNELLDLLGLGGVEKSVLFGLVPNFHAVTLMKLIPTQLGLQKHGTGIAFTLPLSSISHPLLHMFNEEKLQQLIEQLGPIFNDKLVDFLKMKNITAETVKERIDQLMEAEAEQALNADGIRHDLIVALVNQGCSEDLMDEAKKVGARGGTVINARRTGLEDATSFLGMPVQSQKEIILILTENKYKVAIMKAVNQHYGINTDARGVVFSLPVDSVTGLCPVLMDKTDKV